MDMDFIVKLLFLGGKYISQAAGRTILEIIHRSKTCRNNISIQYEKASEIVKPYDNMLELLNERVREASEDDIYFAYMNDELKKQLEDHMRQLSSINTERTNALTKNNWQNETPLKKDDKDTSLSTQPNYDDLEDSLTGKDLEYDNMYTDLCKDLVKQSSDVVNDNVNQINIFKTTQNVDINAIGTKEDSVFKALDDLETDMNISNVENLELNSKKSEEVEKDGLFSLQNINKYTYINSTKKPLSTLYHGDAINMNYLIEQSPIDSYYNTNLINKNMKRPAANTSDNEEQVSSNCYTLQKKLGVKLLNTDDIMQVNNNAIIRGLSQEIENRMVLLNKNREYFKFFEKKLHDRMIRNKVKQISKDVDHRSSVLAHNITHYKKFESKLEKKLKKRINKIVCRKLSSGLSVDSNNDMQKSLKEVVKLLKVNEKEFQKLEEKVTQLMIRQGLDNMCFVKVNYREIEKPRNCLSNSDKEEMKERERILEVNKKAFDNFERDMSRIVILDKNKSTNKEDLVNKKSNEYGINIKKLRRNISRSYSSRYHMLSSALKNPQNINEHSSYKQNAKKQFSKCSLSSRDRDDIRERASILEINTKAFEMFDNKVNNVVPSKSNCNLMISRRLTSRRNYSLPAKNIMKEDELSKTKHLITSDETTDSTDETNALKKLINKSMIPKSRTKYQLKKYKTSVVRNEDVHVENPDKTMEIDEMQQNSFGKISDFNPELDTDSKNENIKSVINTKNSNLHTVKCLKNIKISAEDALINIHNNKSTLNSNSEEENVISLTELESNNFSTEKGNEETYSRNVEDKDFNQKNVFLTKNIYICTDKSTKKDEEKTHSTTLSQKLENEHQTESNSKIPRLNYKHHPINVTPEMQSKFTITPSANFQQKYKFGDCTSKLTKKELAMKTADLSKIADTNFQKKEQIYTHVMNQEKDKFRSKHFHEGQHSKAKGIAYTQSVSSFRIEDDEPSKFHSKNKSIVNKPSTFKGCYQNKVNIKSQTTSCLEGYNAEDNIKSLDLTSKRCNLKKNEQTIKQPKSQTTKMLYTNNQMHSRLHKIPSSRIPKYQENKNIPNEDNTQVKIQLMKGRDWGVKSKAKIEICCKGGGQNPDTNNTISETLNLNNKKCLYDNLHITEQEYNINLINKAPKQYEHKNLESVSIHHHKSLQTTTNNKSIIKFEDMSIHGAKYKIAPSIKHMATVKKRGVDNGNPLSELVIRDKNNINLENNKSASETSVCKFSNTNKQADNDIKLDMKTLSASEIHIIENAPVKVVEANRNSEGITFSKKGKYGRDQTKSLNENDGSRIANYLNYKSTENSNQKTNFQKLMALNQSTIKNENRRTKLSTASIISQKNETDIKNNENEKEKLSLFHTKLAHVTESDCISPSEETFPIPLHNTEIPSVMDKLPLPTEKVKGDIGVTSELRKLDDKSLIRAGQNVIENINTFDNQIIRPQFRNIHNNHNSSSIKTTPSKIKNKFVTNTLPANKSTVNEIRLNAEKLLDKDKFLNKRKYCLKKSLANGPVDSQVENLSIHGQNTRATEMLPLFKSSSKHLKPQGLSKVPEVRREKNWMEKKNYLTKNSARSSFKLNDIYVNKTSMTKYSKTNTERKLSLKPVREINEKFKNYQKFKHLIGTHYRNNNKTQIDSMPTVKKYIEPSKTEVLLNKIRDDVNLDMYYKNFIHNYNRNNKLKEISTRELHRYHPNTYHYMEHKVPNLDDKKELAYEIALSKRNSCFAKRLLRENIPTSCRSMSTRKNTHLFKEVSVNRKSILTKEEKCSNCSLSNSETADALSEKEYFGKKQKKEITSESLKNNKNYASTNFNFKDAKFAFLPLENTKYKNDKNMRIQHLDEHNKKKNIVQHSDSIEELSNDAELISPFLSYFLSRKFPADSTKRM